MKCPTCSEHLTSKVLFEQSVFRCENCDRLWLESTQLGKVIDAMRGSSLEPIARRRVEERIGRCPQCGDQLKGFNYAHDSGVIIQRCMAGHGFSLTAEQLDRIANHRTGTSAERQLWEAAATELSESNRKSIGQQLIRSRLASAIVAALCFAYFASPAGDAFVPFYHTKARWLSARVVFLVISLSLIWFPISVDRLCSQRFAQTLPPELIALMGWMLLLAPIIGAFAYDALG